MLVSFCMGITIEKHWATLLKEEIEKPYVQKLKEFLSEEKKKGVSIYPPEDKVFYALSCTPFDQVNVVIMGQDPYHGKGQAHGLCFSVQKGVKPPPSLVNIFKELHEDLGVPIPSHGCLEKWATQGVLMLNATLTVQQGAPKSHYGKGWEKFTDAIIDLISEKKEPVIFLLWGKSAQEKCETILDQKDHPHVVLKAAHPSPYSAQGFLGCKHFSKTNELLKKWGKSPIDWDIN